MTRLIKLTLKNFKSFRKAEIPISKGFTAIVGSNGSGKSNVLDALLFVLGITSLKTLRAGKLTDLVNNTCKEGYAKVDLTIKGREKEFEVSRMVDKQGKSVYRLDGKRTTLNEINSLLIELGIDISGHNIVTQGDITKIIEMSAIERREIIDNIAGLSEFDQKKQEAIKELEKVDLRIKEATIILNERNTFLSELEQEMNSAREYKELEEERKQIKATIISKELYKIEKRTVEIDSELKEIEKQKEDIEKNVSLSSEELIKSKEEAKEANKKAIKGSEEIYSTIGKEFEEKKSKLNLEKEKIELKKILIEKNLKKISSNKDEAENASKRLGENSQGMKEIEKEILGIQKEIDFISNKKQEIEKVVKSKNNEIVHNENELDATNREIEEKRKEFFDLEVFVKQWEKQKAFNEKKLTELDEELKELESEAEEIIEKKKEIESLQKGLNLESELKKAERKLEEIQEVKSKCISIIEEEEKAIKELEKALSKCPVCDANLESSKKKLIIQQKMDVIEKQRVIEREGENKIANARRVTEEIKEKIFSINRLESDIAIEKAVLEKIVEIKRKSGVLKQEIDERIIAGQLEKKKKMDEKLREMLVKREKIKEKLKDLRAQNIFEEYSNIATKQESLLHNHASLESKINKLRVEQSTFLSNKEGALLENAELENEIEKNQKDINEKKPLLEEIEKDVLSIEKEIDKAKKKQNELIEKKDKLDKKIEKIEKEIINENIKLKKIDARINEFNIEKSRLEVKENDLKEEEKEFEGAEHIGEKTIEELKERIVHVEKRLSDIGAVNMKAVDNFNELKKEVDDIQEKSNKLANERLAVLDMIDKIDVKRTNVFMECFNEVNSNFQNMFFKFFNGEGNLTLSNAEKPLESGLIIDAKTKGVKLQNMDSMSGGEKTLTALAFMFAIQLYSPAPFYAFDEADAALDKENSMKMGNLIEMIAEKSQFIAITHNDTITRKATQIIGVALNKDNSSVIGLKLKNKQDE